MSLLIPEVALDFQKATGHLVQRLLDLISSFHCPLDDLLRIFSHAHSLKPAAIADWSVAQKPVLPRRLRRLAKDGAVIRDRPHPSRELEPLPPGRSPCHPRRPSSFSSGPGPRWVRVASVTRGFVWHERFRRGRRNRRSHCVRRHDLGPLRQPFVELCEQPGIGQAVVAGHRHGDASPSNPSVGLRPGRAARRGAAQDANTPGGWPSRPRQSPARSRPRSWAPARAARPPGMRRSLAISSSTVMAFPHWTHLHRRSRHGEDHRQTVMEPT